MHKCVPLMGTCHHRYLGIEGDDSFISESREYEEEALRLCKGPESGEHIREMQESLRVQEVMLTISESRQKAGTCLGKAIHVIT